MNSMNGGARLRRFWGCTPLEQFSSAGDFYWLLKTQHYYRRYFGRIGQNSRVISPMRLKNVRNMFIGDNVTINKHAFLLTLKLPDSSSPRLVIEDGCVIGHMNHITAVGEVVIGQNVLTADQVHISDNSHDFANPDIPIVQQPVLNHGRVSIGAGSWIGENASVLSCSVGRNCVIGCNSVVLNDIPDYCVAVGAPARVVRRFDPVTRQWRRVDG